jgi:hypothetical protein
LYGTAALAAGAPLLTRPAAAPQRLPLRSAARPAAADGTHAYSMAMHVHTSFSEQDGSMEAQLAQAATNSVDVLWWTDHDHRMDGLGYRDTVHFSSLTEEVPPQSQGKPWRWQKVTHGPLAGQSGGGIVASPSSPNDPVSGGSLRLTAKSSTGATAKYGYFANSTHSDWNYRDNLTGQSLKIDVLLAGGWTDGYLEMLIDTSFHQPSGGRPAGQYSLAYRFVPPGRRAGRTAHSNEGVITIPVVPSGRESWYTAVITPPVDIAALWPDLDYRDFGLYELTLSAASTGELVEGYFDYLRFDRTVSGEAAFRQQQSMGSALTGRYPSVAQQQGLEVSFQYPHINWFGPGVVVPQYGELTESEWHPYLTHTLIPQIHRSGGLVSYNHPFGTSFTTHRLSSTQQREFLVKVATRLLPSGSTLAALGTDLLEVGYRLRGGVDLGHHAGLWDIMSRNAVFLTGNGVTDDHYGQGWRGLLNNWSTSVWAASTGQPDLVAALAAGRAWSGSMSAYPSSMDLLVDGEIPMGAVSVSGVPNRRLSVTATGLASRGSLQVLQGDVDYAGKADPAANTQVIASYPANDLRGGKASLTVDTTAGCFVRTQALDDSGAIVGLSNPVWLLRQAPPRGIPGPRQSLATGLSAGTSSRAILGHRDITTTAWCGHAGSADVPELRRRGRAADLQQLPAPARAAESAGAAGRARRPRRAAVHHRAPGLRAVVQATALRGRDRPGRDDRGPAVAGPASAAPGARHRAAARRPGRDPRDHDPAGLPGVPRHPRPGQRVPVGAVP